MSGYVDVHAHLTHADYLTDREQVIAAAVAAGLDSIIVNGLEPLSNRAVLSMAARHPQIKAALGIYPIEAINKIVAGKLPFAVSEFDVDAEISFIRQQALAGEIIAIGECGLDGHWAREETFAEQERVFIALIAIALESQLPLIIHTRKREQRAMEILAYHKVEAVDFHCFGGKSKWAVEWAEKYGWYFSIPANARVNQSFTKMLKELPAERILTETDCPYLGPVRGQRNEPKNVVDTVAYLSELRAWTLDQAKIQVYTNYQRLFLQAKRSC